jgi:hypothetical protein
VDSLKALDLKRPIREAGIFNKSLVEMPTNVLKSLKRLRRLRRRCADPRRLKPRQEPFALDLTNAQTGSRGNAWHQPNQRS